MKKVILKELIASPNGVFRVGLNELEDDFAEVLINAGVATEIIEEKTSTVQAEEKPIETRVQKVRNKATTARAK